MKWHLSLNPVLVKEMRGRMRGPRAYLFLTGTLALFGAVTYGLYRLVRFTFASSGAMSAGAQIGQSIFTGLVFLSTIVICVIAPSLTASAISGEHERKTFDLLLATPLSASAVLLGKLIASLSYVALILLAAVPLVSLAFVFGGVAAVDMLLAFLMLLNFGLTFGVIGLFFSALFRRTGWAVGASYLALALFVLGTVFAYAVISGMRGEQPAIWLLGLNPFSAMASVLNRNIVPAGVPGRLIPSLTWAMSGARSNLQLAADKPLWQFTVGIYGWLTVVLYLLATQLIKPVRRFQPRSQMWRTVGLLVVISIAVPPVVYGPLTPDRLEAWVRWMLSPQRDLISNGQFTAPIEQSWEIALQRQGDDRVMVMGDRDKRVVRFSRKGDDHFETSITQAINQMVPEDGWLQVRAVLRVHSQDVEGCGTHGDECPLAIRLNYDDAQGNKHMWLQAFYASGANAMICGPCEIHPVPIKVPQGEWYTYESGNLLQRRSGFNVLPPRLIRSIKIWAAGHSYEAEVREVALLVRDGRPLDWTGNNNSFPTPTPFFGDGIMIQREFVAPVAPPVKVAPVVPPRLPTATPAMR